MALHRFATFLWIKKNKNKKRYSTNLERETLLGRVFGKTRWNGGLGIDGERNSRDGNLAVKCVGGACEGCVSGDGGSDHIPSSYPPPTPRGPRVVVHSVKMNGGNDVEERGGTDEDQRTRTRVCNLAIVVVLVLVVGVLLLPPSPPPPPPMLLLLSLLRTAAATGKEDRSFAHTRTGLPLLYPPVPTKSATGPSPSTLSIRFFLFLSLSPPPESEGSFLSTDPPLYPSSLPLLVLLHGNNPLAFY